MTRKKTIKRAPILVKLISLLYIIGAFFCIFGGIILLVGMRMFSSSPGVGLLMVQYSVNPTIINYSGVFLIAFSVFLAFTGYGLWKLKNWARVAAIAISILGILFSFGFLIPLGIIKIIVNALIIYYLGFSKEGKKVFG
jgi:lysylphosphatidylglycerol synthetase-like protein (DUF2156 family)